GLVFNRGERVEGYTNFLWVLELALGMKLGVGPETASVALGAVATAALGYVMAKTALASPLARGSVWPAAALLFLLRIHRSVAVWATSGLETRQFTLFCSAGIALAGAGLLRERWQTATLRLPLPLDWADVKLELLASLALALAEATRPEGALACACVA